MARRSDPITALAAGRAAANIQAAKLGNWRRTAEVLHKTRHLIHQPAVLAPRDCRQILQRICSQCEGGSVCGKNPARSNGIGDLFEVAVGQERQSIAISNHFALLGDLDL